MQQSHDHQSHLINQKEQLEQKLVHKEEDIAQNLKLIEELKAEIDEKVRIIQEQKTQIISLETKTKQFQNYASQREASMRHDIQNDHSAEVKRLTEQLETDTLRYE